MFSCGDSTENTEIETNNTIEVNKQDTIELTADNQDSIDLLNCGPQLTWEEYQDSINNIKQ